MILKESRELEWIQQLRTRYPYTNPTLIEKAIRAFSLLEALSISGCPFVFKGGTALMLHMNSAKPKDKDTIMAEDFFSTEAYSAIIAKEEIEKKQSHKDFRNFKTNIASAIKTHIENHYNSSSFKEEWYDGFKPVLNKLLEVFNLN